MGTAGALRAAARGGDGRKIQEVLDPHVLLAIELSPDSRLQIARGPAEAVGEDPLGLPGTVGIATKEPHEPEVRVPTAEKIFQDGTDTPVEGSMGVPEPFSPDL